MEAEYAARSITIQEVVWLRRFLDDLEIITSPPQLVTIHCDSQAAICFTKDAKYHSKSKHIEAEYNFMRDIMARKKC